MGTGFGCRHMFSRLIGLKKKKKKNRVEYKEKNIQLELTVINIPPIKT